MLKLIGDRGIGKTKELIEFAVDNNCVILSANDDKLREKVVSMGYSPFIVAKFSPDVIKSIIDSDVNVVMDDIDICISKMFGEKFKGFTLTK